MKQTVITWLEGLSLLVMSILAFLIWGSAGAGDMRTFGMAAIGFLLMGLMADFYTRRRYPASQTTSN